jgi:hypothetical protein
MRNVYFIPHSTFSIFAFLERSGGTRSQDASAKKKEQEMELWHGIYCEDV